MEEENLADGSENYLQSFPENRLYRPDYSCKCDDYMVATIDDVIEKNDPVDMPIQNWENLHHPTSRFRKGMQHFGQITRNASC